MARDRTPWRKRVYMDPGREARRQEKLREEAAAQEAYRRDLERAREAAVGRDGAKTRRFQATVYTALGIDPKAGFDGSPPAFLPDKEVNSASQVVGSGFKNVSRDPIQRMWARGEIDDAQFRGATAFVQLLERASTLGVRGVAWGERVDGGMVANVPVEAMTLIGRVRALRRFMGERELRLLHGVCVARLTLTEIARSEQCDRRTVSRRFRAALDRAARFFG